VSATPACRFLAGDLPRGLAVKLFIWWLGQNALVRLLCQVPFFLAAVAGCMIFERLVGTWYLALPITVAAIGFAAIALAIPRGNARFLGIEGLR
jgi:hypothetical protein